MMRGHRDEPRAGERIVMLVQNGVHGDSRVQKAAASAAAAGWDVVLLGRSHTRHEQTWDLGGARVRLLPVKRAQALYEVRGGRLRAPLAYPPGPMRAQRERHLKGRHADIGERKARQAAAARHQHRAVTAARALALLPRRAVVKVAATWIRFRAAQSDRLRRGREAGDSRLDRWTRRFWAAVLGDRLWRRLDPGLWEFEHAYGKVVDKLEPDLIHANDFQMLGVGARAAVRAAAAGRRVPLVWDAHEYLPGIKPWVRHPNWHPAQLAHEREYARSADAVVTVSSTLAKLLRQRHRLAHTPTVVLNAPDVAGDLVDAPGLPDLRRECGLEPDVPLMVYSGAAAEQRGLADMVEALPSLEGVHCAFVVSKTDSRFMRGLVSRAAELGAADRLHVLPYVEYWQVVPFLSSADVGVIPLHHYQNHELALITKFFEYAHARLPIVVSDVATMGEAVREHGVGEVFRAQDTQDLARAVKAVLGEPERYRAALEEGPIDEWTWAAQAERLHALYRRLLR